MAVASNRRLSQGTTWRREWLQRILGADYFHDVVCVGLDNVATDADLAALAELRHLKLLYPGGGRVSDEGLKHLANLTGLRLLVLWGNPISGHGVESLSGLKRLRHLDLSRTQVTDRRLAGLGSLTGLERLDIANNPQLDGSFRAYVADLPNLQSLVLRGSGITDSALSHLKDARNLQALMLDRTRITDDGLHNLRGLTSLLSFDLSVDSRSGRGERRRGVVIVDRLVGIPRARQA